MSFIPSLEGFAKGAFATAAGLSTVGAGLLYYGQNYLIYPSAFPQGARLDVPKPSDWGLEYEDLILNTPDNVKVSSYLMVQKRELGSGATGIDTRDFESDEEFAATRPTILMFHGNGGNVGHRVPLGKVFYTKMRCNVVMAEYRGYGHSQGSPSEKGIRMDAQAHVDFITNHPVLGRTVVILYGQSIGGAVAIDLASRNPTTVRALILENTFLSLPKMVPHALPFLGPFSFLCHQKWDSASRLPLIPTRTPILMLSGTQDEVVPPEHMRELWKIAQGRAALQSAKASEIEAGTRFSSYVEFAKGTHNDTCVQEGYWARVADFISTLSALPAVRHKVDA